MEASRYTLKKTDNSGYMHEKSLKNHAMNRVLGKLPLTLPEVPGKTTGTEEISN